MRRSDVMSLGPVSPSVIELPHVVIERGELRAEVPRHAVPGHCGPSLVVDPAVAGHLEVLGLPALLSLGLVEGIGH
jgi:hypothetical protein